VALACVLTVIAVPLALAVDHNYGPPTTAATVTVGGTSTAPAIPDGFVGLSMEYQSAAASAGPADDPDTVFQQLVRNITPGQQPVLRIGGDSTDHTWYPTSAIKHPSPGLSYALTPAWVQSIATAAHDLDAKLILGINLEADSKTVAQHEAAELVAQGIPHSAIEGMEIGNEPNLYGGFPWYTTKGGKAVAGRPRSYSLKNYLSDLKKISAGVQHVPLAGPALGTLSWLPNVKTLLKAAPRISVLTFHDYPMSCYGRPGTPQYPSIANLLGKTDSIGLAAQIAPYAAAAEKTGRQFRIDELNNSSCGGKSGVSDTFATALWSLNTLFALAQSGISGVNFHTFPSARYHLFTFGLQDGHWVADVAPEYYGLMLFAQAAPAGSHLLKVSTGGDSELQAWATKSTSTTHVVLINDSTTRASAVTLHVPGGGVATAATLTAPAANATAGVTYGGLSFAPDTTTGQLAGTPVVQQLSPGADGTYSVTVPPVSAEVLTLPTAG
jgi:Glycosyl hydrolase family 79 C-terminal beta domain